MASGETDVAVGRLVQVRAMVLRDAPGVENLIRDCYGTGLFHRHWYSAERLAHYHRDGTMCAMVAVNRTGEIVGHLALLRRHPLDPPSLMGKRRRARLGQLAIPLVRPGYGGDGVLARIMAAALGRASSWLKGLDGVFYAAAAGHVFAQVAIYRHGFLDCGFLLDGVSLSGAKDMADVVRQGGSVILTYLPRARRAIRRIYPPLRHRDMVLAIFEHLGVAVRCGKPRVRGVRGLTVAATVIESCPATASIKVLHCGDDAIVYLNREVRIARVLGCRTILLHLNLNDASTADVAEAMERQGFFFGGVLPGTAIGDALILQYVELARACPAWPQLVSAQARRIAAYVRRSRDVCIAMREGGQILGSGE